MATYNDQAYTVNLTYGDRNAGHVYSQVFNENLTWSSRVQIDLTGTTYNRLSSIAVDNNNGILTAYSGYNSTWSRYTVRYRQVSGSGGSPAKEWIETGDALSPAITYYNRGGTYPYGTLIIYYTSGKNVFTQNYSGSPTGDWTQNELAYGDGLCGNLTHETSSSGLPIQMWTNQDGSPYYMPYNSQGLPKVNFTNNLEYHRAVEITDSLTNSNLRIEISQPIITTTSGKKILLQFTRSDESIKQLTLSNIFDFLKTDRNEIGENINNISYEVYVNASQPDTLQNGLLNKNIFTPFKNISFKFSANDENNKDITDFGITTISNQQGLFNFKKSFSLNAQQLISKTFNLSFNVDLKGDFKVDNLLYSLVDVTINKDSSIEKGNKSISVDTNPNELILNQNFPNPFNPNTEIKYSVKENGLVTLKVYDILGKEVKTLVNQQQVAGTYSVNFDASKLSSGVYFYSISVGDFYKIKKMILMK